MTRKKFEKTEWELASDGLWTNPNADKNCKTCNGHGTVDLGYDTGCILANCPDCWKRAKMNE